MVDKFEQNACIKSTSSSNLKSTPSKCFLRLFGPNPFYRIEFYGGVMLRVINMSDENVEHSKQPIISKISKDVEKIQELIHEIHR